jgi:RHS repeat-associated protein
LGTVFDGGRSNDGAGNVLRRHNDGAGIDGRANSSKTFHYTGRRIDAETNGLYYCRARMYHPALGQIGAGAIM